MNPTEIALSKNFLLSDFLGCHSVYARGLPNSIDPLDPELPVKLGNARALCENVLEPILEAFGPISIGYGYISPATSRAIVTYQDPNQPSYHLWNKGAAADICVHRWINRDPDDDTLATSPIAFARLCVERRLPFSRLITYSESPYLCIAASKREIEEGNPRLALYENRYRGSPKAKPDFIKYSSERARGRAGMEALTYGWRGAGHPTYHTGGRRQTQHFRVSKYTMLSDWLFNLSLITNGGRNIPPITTPHMELFYTCGDFYDALIDALEIPRMSITSGYSGKWTHRKAQFTLSLPDEALAQNVIRAVTEHKPECMEVQYSPYSHSLEVEVRL